jgi:hypothetical protein
MGFAPLRVGQMARMLRAPDRGLHERFRAEIAASASVPLPGGGRTAERFRYLTDVATRGVVLARLVEGHLDAVAILAEAGSGVPDGALGVWAASNASHRLVAMPAPGGWHIHGSKPYASGASTLTHALVSADAPDGPRLFLIETAGAIEVIPGSWPAVGMQASDSATVNVDTRVTDDASIGGVEWYFRRPGFWHGSVGVAACWLGGARAVARALRQAHSPHALAHLGAVDASLAAATALLEQAAREIDAAPFSVADAAELRALRVRSVVEGAATDALTRVGRALGAGPLCHDEEHAHLVADLTVYLRQSHAETDLERIGRLVAGHA